MFKKLMLTVGAAGLAGTLIQPAQAETYNLTLSGASPGGLWSRIGGGIDAAIAAAYPGSTVTYQTSSGGLANIPMVAGGRAPMGLATDGDLALALAGASPFKKPITNVRVLFRAYTSASRFQLTHLMLNTDFVKKHGISSFEEIVKRKLPLRVAINRKGNSDGDVSEQVMAAMGATIKDIESWGGQVVRAASKEQVSLMLDRRIDMANFGIAFNHPRIREIAKGIDVTMLPISVAAAAKVAKQYGGEVCEIKAGEYKFAAAQKSVCVGAVIVANANMDAGLAYNITKAMIEKIEVFKNNSHKAIKASATPQSLAYPSIAAHHPGSAKFLKSKGLLK